MTFYKDKQNGEVVELIGSKKVSVVTADGKHEEEGVELRFRDRAGGLAITKAMLEQKFDLVEE